MTTDEASSVDVPDGTPESSDDHHDFWADDVADEIEARDPDEPVVIKGGVSPSGVAHLGNFNEIMRGYFVAEVLRERGHEVRQVFTSDDKDPLRKLPRKLADADGNIVGLGEVDAGALGRNLGKPYTSIPDPFGETDSYAAHFAALLKADADRLGVPVEMISNTKLYENGDFDPVVEHVLEHIDTAREVLSEYQSKVDDDYVPFNPVCEACGKITETVTDIDLEAGTIEYTCTDMTVGDNTIDGCGHDGTATFREGKLPWRFEWPGQWQVLGVDFEPFGKDHAEGSWPSGKDIAENVLEIEPPVPMVYEWFTLNGKALSSSAGNIVTVPEMLELLEPEVLRYFFALNPRKARDLDLTRLDQLVDDFDRFERAYFGEVDDESLTRFAKRAYPFVVDDVREDRIRLPYTFAAVLGMTDDEDLRVKMARNEGFFDDDTPEDVIDEALGRVERARRWAEKMDNQYNYRLQVELPEFDFEPAVESALDDLADFVAEGHDGEEIQGEIYETAREHDIEMGDFFAAGYRLFFDDTQGPRLGEFLGELEQDFVVTRLRRED
ncbi:lysine--tRNA ligase [Haloferax mediterranei ATCC 33500]|uniref:Lysine--tRNA ligase n=1 Tax=Haloferax mediterranei (strain ATCC 33500 / DSM 1411 / JCM 8866 / NBRC 14739 / NCIMB 2177 / R-4) TaxID=523841 RepID=I3R5Y4_HALMT|nr:lysine--tRNA ligase [Haloferax mediterranei]AFK19644.1 lysyl-tRNA synthetase [Haloferax mediterranei ATCC 33500]AHZ23032.1 lysyl-tRNA synthetase [Haloferax mediterranei ATCC 33500]ELZ99962.1 lysyl-tRNA ligase [Haloferax mediterranei ATCC 33500]MDX5987616.1 lysine--tRNA ligase [Haloferax mediterranei ATCC 33500]QCQ74103.1 lysine--tRNA ligase [Haloferax mediterranei ATCC 33500]